MSGPKHGCHKCYTDSMTAKQALVPLFVRVPAHLKQRLERSIFGMGTSMSSEVARILEEGIAASFPLEMNKEGMQATLRSIRDSSEP